MIVDVFFWTRNVLNVFDSCGCSFLLGFSDLSSALWYVVSRSLRLSKKTNSRSFNTELFHTRLSYSYLNRFCDFLMSLFVFKYMTSIFVTTFSTNCLQRRSVRAAVCQICGCGQQWMTRRITTQYKIVQRMVYTQVYLCIAYIGKGFNKHVQMVLVFCDAVSYAGGNGLFEKFGWFTSSWTMRFGAKLPCYKLSTARLIQFSHELCTVVRMELCEISKRYYWMVEELVRLMRRHSLECLNSSCYHGVAICVNLHLEMSLRSPRMRNNDMHCNRGPFPGNNCKSFLCLHWSLFCAQVARWDSITYIYLSPCSS